MVKVALFVRLEAKPGKEKEVESFLVSGLPIVNEEPATTAWFGIRLGPSTFGIFDAFPDEAGRQAHLSGKVAAALMAKAGGAVGELRSAQRQHVLAGFVAYACPSWTLNVDSARGLAMRGIAGGQMAIMAGWRAAHVAPAATRQRRERRSRSPQRPRQQQAVPTASRRPPPLEA